MTRKGECHSQSKLSISVRAEPKGCYKACSFIAFLLLITPVTAFIEKNKNTNVTAVVRALTDMVA